jgi:hypothetical protein
MEINIRLTIDDRIVGAARWLSRTLPVRRAGLLAALATMSATAVTAAPVTRPHEFAAGDRIRADQINESFDVIYDELNARFIRNDMTIEVDDCDGLVRALGDIDDKRIGSSAVVTIELPAGTFACPTITVDHVDGHHLNVVGQGSGETTLTFHDNHGFVIPMSRAVGLIDKLTLEGPTFEGSGVLAWGNASAKLGTDLVVREFQIGVRAAGSYIIADGVIAEDNMAAGFEASFGSFMSANGAIARTNNNGFVSYLGSSMIANGATAEGHAQYGFDANAGSVLQAGPQGDQPVVSSNNEHCFNSNANSTLVVFNGSASMCHYGFTAWKDSFIGASDTTSDDHELEGFSSRHGSYVQVQDVTGNDVTFFPAAAGVFHDAEGSMSFELVE